MTRSGILQVISFFLYLFFQVLFLKNLVLFQTAFCFLYVAYLLLLPVETNPMMLMGLGFVLGFVIDIFYDSLGIHTMASVFIMYLRNYWLSRITPQGGYDSGALPGVAAHGVQWFLVYAVPMLFLHHTVLFFVEAGGFDYTGFTLVKVIASVVFTTSVIFIVQFLFPGRRRI